MPYGVFDCRYVGVLYLFLAFFSGILGFGFSACMRYELLFPYDFLNDDFYYVCLTSHAVMMVFFFLTVSAGGFFNVLLPGFLFCSDFFFPRVNLFSVLLLFISFFLVVVSLFVGGVGTGWTLYPPLSHFVFGKSVDIFIVSVHFFTISSVLSSINVICTVFFFKCSSVRYLDLGVFVWSAVITSFLNVLSLPYFSSALTMLLLDRSFNTVFFNPVFGGDPLLFQSLFWFWGHPEVYILVIPVFGLISLIVGYLIDNEFIFGHYCVIVSLISIGFLGFLVWGHHMVTVGWSSDLKSFFMASTVAISIPTGLKVFNWISSLYFYGCFSNLNNVFFYFVYVFIVFFVIGGSSGIILSNYSADVLLHDTYFVVGHFHFVLSLASFIGFVAALVFFWPVITGGLYINCDLVIVYLIGFFFFSFFTFLPFHFLGISGCPRRVFCYSDGYFSWFYFSSLGFMGLTLNLFFLIFIFFISFNKGLSFFQVFIIPSMKVSFFFFYIVLGFLITSFCYIFTFWVFKRGCYKSEDARCKEPLYVNMAGDLRHRKGVDPCQSKYSFKTANWDFYKDGCNSFLFHTNNSLNAFFCILAKARVGKRFAKFVSLNVNDFKMLKGYCCFCFFSLVFLFFYIPLDILLYDDFRFEGKFFTFVCFKDDFGIFDSYYGSHLCTFNVFFIRFVNFSFFTFLFIFIPFFFFPFIFPGINRFFYVFCIFFCFIIFSFELLQLILLFLLSFSLCLGRFFCLLFPNFLNDITFVYKYLKCFFILFFFFIIVSDGVKPAFFIFFFVLLFVFVFFLFFNIVCFFLFLIFIPFKGVGVFHHFCEFFRKLLFDYYGKVKKCLVFIVSFNLDFDGFVYKFINYFFYNFFSSIRPCFKDVQGVSFNEFKCYFILFFQFVVFSLVSSFFFGWLFYNFINEAYFLFIGVFGVFGCTGWCMAVYPLLEDIYKHNSRHFREVAVNDYEKEMRPIYRFCIKYNWVYSIAWWYFLFNFFLLMTGLATSVYCNFTPGVVSLFFWTGFFLLSPYYLSTPFVFTFFLYCFVYGTNFNHEVAFKCLFRFLYLKGDVFLYVFFRFFFSYHLKEVVFIKFFYLIFMFFYDLLSFFIEFFCPYSLTITKQKNNVRSGDFVLFSSFSFFLAFFSFLIFYIVFFLRYSPYTLVYNLIFFSFFFILILFLFWYLYHRMVKDLCQIYTAIFYIFFSVLPYMLMVVHVFFYFVVYLFFLIFVNLCKDMRLIKCYFFLKMVSSFIMTVVSFILLFAIVVISYLFYGFFFIYHILYFIIDFSCMVVEYAFNELRKYLSGNK